jgi:uncharacterized SAM-binding protein YcdF (DUF218 family)
MQLLKAIADLLTQPLVVAALLLLAAVALRLLRFRSIAATAAGVAVAGTYFSSIPLGGQALLGPLERSYPPLTSLPSVDTVVVLGSSYSPLPGIPVAAALDDAGLARIVSGVVWAERLGARLVVSGGAPAPREPSARGYAALAQELGVSPGRIVELDEPLDTGDEAVAVAALLESRPFLLVTSAYHMPRAMRLMERAGARPIPAPTDQQVAVYDGLRWVHFVPRSSALRQSEEALHEYIGLAAIAAGFD